MKPYCPNLRVWVLAALLGGSPTAMAQGSKSDYDRVASLAGRTEGKVFRQRVQAHWLTGPNTNSFWYRIETGPNRHEFVRVHAELGQRKPLFDHAQLAAALVAQGNPRAIAAALPIEQLDFKDGRFTFSSEGKRWAFDPTTGTLTAAAPVADLEFSPAATGPQRSRRTGGELSLTFVNQSSEDVELFWLDLQGERHSYGRLRPDSDRVQHTFAGHVWLVTDRIGTSLGVFEATEDANRVVINAQVLVRREKAPADPSEGSQPKPASGISPDGRWRAVVRDQQVVIFSTDPVETEVFRSREGSKENAYANHVVWSPDSTRLIARRVVPGQEHLVHFVEAAPADQLQPKLHSHAYLKPGDRLPKPQLVLFDVAAKSQVVIPDTLYANPFTEDGDLEGRWTQDSREFRFAYNQRGHQLFRLLAVNGQTGAIRTVVEETAKTFIDWTAKAWHEWLEETDEVLWMSERDGWCHLYCYDATTGRLKNQITRGEWVVRHVERVDAAQRLIWFFAGGIRPEQDPYQQHFCRVNFDGTGLVVLTRGDGNHKVEFSPDRRWFVDTWSRVDHPPVSELRRALDGELVLELERADASALLATGWTLPERLVAQARDGRTDIHGIIVRPANFDPTKKYPVIEEVYAGPQAAYVPKEFGRMLRAQTWAELGFVFVQVDGLGTSQRSKAFHDVCYKNLADAGFLDRIAWIKAAGASRPWMDLTRVGIYGGSAGGQNALRALLDHGDFYSAAVADCGCHDNRMDKIWWNEQWLGWPVDESYVRSSNVADAAKLRGHLLLIVGEVDRNVDPASTMQVVAALEKADKDFELLVMTGTNHGAAETPYGTRRRMDFLVRQLHHREPRWE